MSKKTHYITLWIGVALGFTALILGFLCKFGLAFLFMMITHIYAGCIHPALGEDITAQVVRGKELQDLLAKIK